MSCGKIPSREEFRHALVQKQGEQITDKLAQATVAEYLASAKYDLRRIAVERNCEIVPKAKYAEVVLEAGDVVEVVNFVGGG